MKEKILTLPPAARLLAPVIIVGLCLGLGIGLYIGWIAWPLQITNVDISDLKGSAQDDYIALTAQTFAYDQNVDDASARLGKLNDPKIVDRVGNLAITYASQGKPASAQLARLAVAMGSQNDGVALLAATPEPTATLFSPTTAATNTLTPIATETISATAVLTATGTPTRRLTPTPTRLLGTPYAPTFWIPALSAWPTPKYEPANVAPGQAYWHLTKGMWCDFKDKHDYCQDLPGGDSAPTTYVMLLNPNGTRGSAPLMVTKPDGKFAGPDDIGIEKSADDMCRCNYAFLSNGWIIQVGTKTASDKTPIAQTFSDKTPSDKISGLALPEHQHVRYFLTFQLVAR